jgi:Amidohydrolase family
MGAAYQAGLDGKVGLIKVGKLADLIVLDRNLFEIPPHEIHTAKVVMTIMNGKVRAGAADVSRCDGASAPIVVGSAAFTERTIAPRLPSRQVLRGSAGPLAANVDDVRLSGKAVEVDRWNWSGLQKASPIFFATTSPPSDVVDETGAKSAVVEDKATATADVEFDQATQVNVISTIPPDQQEIQRRRELVRALFNDFWNGSDDKPVTFVDRLNQAEPYLNKRLTACGESWQLDANTRKLLGLPPRAN